MNPEDVKTMFDGFDPARYEDEAKQRWGHTDAYKESARRTKQYTKDDWQAIEDESGAIYAGLAEHMKRGAPVTDASVQDLVEQHRLHTERWFYPCSKDMQRELGEMYVADPRFTANLDGTYGDGFAAYLRDAICLA